MNIEVQALTTYKVEPDGQSVALGVQDTSGKVATLKMRISELGNLVMTLPSIIEAALRRQYRDASLRYTYPLASWQIEPASDPEHLIVTMRTDDGFGVSFSMPRQRAAQFGKDVSSGVREQPHIVAH
jgi:hypothetical protein